MYKGLPLQSNHWDMVIKVKAGSSLSATPFFDLLGFKVMASWPGSEKACPQCKAVGHDSHSCPRRPTPKKSKKHNSPSSQHTRTTPATPSSSKIADTADTAAKATPTSNPTPPLPISTPSSPLPRCLLNMSDELLDRFSRYSDDQFRAQAEYLQKNQKKQTPEAKAFLELPTETVAAAIKWAVFLKRPLP